MGKASITWFLGLAVAGLPSIASAGTPHVNRLSTPVTAEANGLRQPQRTATTAGRELISVTLKTDPVEGDRAALEAEQAAFLARCMQIPNTRLIGRTKLVLNAIFLEIDSAHLTEISADPAVRRVHPVGNYQVDLAETVPYIGASAVQALGTDGAGVTVAVLDSGIDYEHADLGGSGLVADYLANNPNVVEPGTFPTTKVVGGFDFVGEAWPNGPLQPDADPLAAPGVGDHGNHVADIIAGVNGVAPGASLYGVKVCSAVSSACSGIAIIQGIEFAADPNGDGDTSDHVDIINMSLGANFGQPFDDDSAEAVENATKIGIFTVASAGNGGDRPFVTGTPAAAASALSVAQTSVPSAQQDQMEVTAPATAAGLYVAVRQTWSGQLTSAISGPVQYADGAGGNLDGCAPFTAGSLTGQIVMVDRGGCFFSDKIRNIEDAGGILGIIGLVASGAPFAGGFGGGTAISIPGFMINQADADILRTGAAAVSFDPANAISLAGSMVASSSRGPRNFDNQIKPEIGAPGASLSAEGGTGTERTTFGGTSGAAPMVAGAAALIKQARPWARPWLMKTLLMNNADINVSVDFTGVPAEITRIGAGEVNVYNAVESAVIVLAEPSGTAEISMGYVPVSRSRQVMTRKVLVINNEPFARTFDISSSFRFANDAASNAIEIRHPSRVRVAGASDREFTVRFIINGENLPLSQMSSGGSSNNPAALTATEFDGYISISDARDSVDMPWHIIPRKSADVRATKRLRLKNGTADITLNNRGVGPANNDAYTLLAVSPEIGPGAAGTQSPTPDLKGVGVRTTAVPAGFCSANPSFLINFAFNTWEAQTHVIPVVFLAEIDLDNDGTPEFQAINGDFDAQLLGENSLDGRSVSIAFDLVNGGNGAFFFAEHATNTNNTVITFCAEQFGLTAADLGTKDITVTFNAVDFYFGGPGDTTGPVTFTLGGGYTGIVSDIDPKSTGMLSVTDNGGTSPDLGIMLFTNGDRGATNRGGATRATEARYITRPGVKLPNGF